jgi:hypothetical protein
MKERSLTGKRALPFESGALTQTLRLSSSRTISPFMTKLYTLHLGHVAQRIADDRDQVRVTGLDAAELLVPPVVPELGRTTNESEAPARASPRRRST